MVFVATTMEPLRPGQGVDGGEGFFGLPFDARQVEFYHEK